VIIWARNVKHIASSGWAQKFKAIRKTSLFCLIFFIFFIWGSTSNQKKCEPATLTFVTKIKVFSKNAVNIDE